MSVYDFEVKDSDGNMVSLSEFKDKVLLIVNSATKCGFTPQYTELNEIYNEFKDEGFEILDFPCNQFGAQAPGSSEEIAEVCRNKWLVPYQIFDKIDVNGENADPLLNTLKTNSLSQTSRKRCNRIKTDVKSKRQTLQRQQRHQMELHQFLVDRQENVFRRFEPTEDLGDVKSAVKDLL